MIVQALWLTGKLGYMLSFEGRPAKAVNLTISVPAIRNPTVGAGLLCGGGGRGGSAGGGSSNFQ